MKLDRIDYNGGEIWVDKEADLHGKVYAPNIGKIIGTIWDGSATDKKIKKFLDLKVIVAQSITNPSYIDGIPFVEVGEDDWEIEKMGYAAADEGGEKTSAGYHMTAKIYWVKGYKTAQAKQFTEEDMRKAWEAGVHFNEESSESFGPIESVNKWDNFINSLKPKVSSIEIEMNDKFIPVDQFNSNFKAKPITYQKDGKTFLKVKQVNYD